GAAGVDRALRVSPDHGDVADVLEVAPGAGDGAAGADARHEVGDRAVGVAPDLRAGRLVVGGGSVEVLVLVGLVGALDLLRQPVAHGVVGLRVLRRHGGRGDDDLGAVGLEHVDLVLAHLVGADEDALVAALLGDQGQADAGVAGRGLHDGATRLELALGLGCVDDLDRDPVLDGATGVDVLDLGQD